MQTGFEFTSARREPAVEEQPTQQPMAADKKIRRKPSADQKKVRRRKARTEKTAASHEESHVNREAEILNAMANASSEEQAVLMGELNAIRRAKREAVAADRELDLSQTVVSAVRTPVRTHERSTPATDWLDKVATVDTAQDTDFHRVQATASRWVKSLHPMVLADTHEFTQQAIGQARIASSGADGAREALQQHFLSTANRLRAQAGYTKTAEFEEERTFDIDGKSYLVEVRYRDPAVHDYEGYDYVIYDESTDEVVVDNHNPLESAEDAFDDAEMYLSDLGRMGSRRTANPAGDSEAGKPLSERDPVFEDEEWMIEEGEAGTVSEGRRMGDVVADNTTLGAVCRPCLDEVNATIERPLTRAAAMEHSCRICGTSLASLKVGENATEGWDDPDSNEIKDRYLGSPPGFETPGDEQSGNAQSGNGQDDDTWVDPLNDNRANEPAFEEQFDNGREVQTTSRHRGSVRPGVTAGDGRSVEVASLPNCDFCGQTAQYDGKTGLGPWANMCKGCFLNYGVGLGTGRGQELILKSGSRKQSELVAGEPGAGGWPLAPSPTFPGEVTLSCPKCGSTSVSMEGMLNSGPGYRMLDQRQSMLRCKDCGYRTIYGTTYSGEKFSTHPEFDGPHSVRGSKRKQANLPVNVGDWSDDDWAMHEMNEIANDPDTPSCDNCGAKTYDLLPSMENRGDQICIGCAKAEDRRMMGSRKQAADFEDREFTECRICGKAVEDSEAGRKLGFCPEHADQARRMFAPASKRRTAADGELTGPDGEAFPWELPEEGAEEGEGAADVAAVPTPGQSEADYPQPSTAKARAFRARVQAGLARESA